MSSNFEYFLRTGRRSRSATPIETKFNPWHDAEDGRFTFAGQGQFFPGRTTIRRRTGDDGFSGNGGGWGGGGATESWEGSSGDDTSGTRPAPVRHSPKPTIVVSAPAARPKAATVRQQSRLTQYANGYAYVVDAHARTRGVSGELKLQWQPREKRVQLDAGKPDRRSTDQGGHYIAARFNGPGEWFNHFAQDTNFNKSAYYTLENQWARALRSGRRVFVDIVPHYEGDSMRPYKIVVRWSAGRGEVIEEFPNERREK